MGHDKLMVQDRNSNNPNQYALKDAGQRAVISTHALWAKVTILETIIGFFRLEIDCFRTLTDSRAGQKVG